MIHSAVYYFMRVCVCACSLLWTIMLNKHTVLPFAVFPLSYVVTDWLSLRAEDEPAVYVPSVWNLRPSGPDPVCPPLSHFHSFLVYPLYAYMHACEFSLPHIHDIVYTIAYQALTHGKPWCLQVPYAPWAWHLPQRGRSLCGKLAALQSTSSTYYCACKLCLASRFLRS